jgi:hypothetical protein
MSLNPPAFLALKGPPEIAQGETLGLEYKCEISPEGASYKAAKKLGTPLQGSPYFVPGTQGFTLGYVRSPLWGCLGSHV